MYYKRTRIEAENIIKDFSLFIFKFKLSSDYRNLDFDYKFYVNNDQQKDLLPRLNKANNIHIDDIDIPFHKSIKSFSLRGEPNVVHIANKTSNYKNDMHKASYCWMHKHDFYSKENLIKLVYEEYNKHLVIRENDFARSINFYEENIKKCQNQIKSLQTKKGLLYELAN